MAVHKVSVCIASHQQAASLFCCLTLCSLIGYNNKDAYYIHLINVSQVEIPQLKIVLP